MTDSNPNDNSILHLCFIGMSNCGKSFRSQQLEREFGFCRYCVDDAIEERIQPELVAQGFKGIEGMAQWLGQPYDQQFAKNQATYLALEEELMFSVNFGRDENAVLDTTGSAINVDGPERIRDRYFVVHLEATEEIIGEMIERYFQCPKPVAWGDTFDQKEGETGEEALRRCYPKMLRIRLEKYRNLADISIPATVALDPAITAQDWLNIIKEKKKQLNK